MKKTIWLLMLPWILWAAELTPKEAALAFWKAMAAGKTDAAKALTVWGEVKSALPLKLRIAAVEAKEGNVTAGRASVPTELTLALPAGVENNMTCRARFDTALLNVAGRWVVDGRKTMGRYDKAATAAFARCGARLFDSLLEEGMHYFERFNKMIEEENGSLQKAMREWQKELEEMMRTLPESPREKPGQLPPPEKGETI
ncbi:hypothetical protein [Hydrogenimonas sp. SS33]|uniref:hypothetical protein n=1 Tax=Hydrogenimonas leucolamina TaxID=2954236 RepID=UPI00336BBB09